MNEIYDVLCSGCKLRLFRVISGSKEKPIVCYVANCPECGSDSFNKRLNRGRIDSDYPISDAEEEDGTIRIRLEKRGTVV